MTNMRVFTMAAIRNARGLNASEKAMLYTIESRGEVFSTADTLRDDCGMGRNKFYEVRGRLISLGLVEATVRRPRGTTRYRVNHEAVAAMAPMSDTQISPPEETSERGDINVTSGSHLNLSPLGTAMSPAVATQREPWKGTPQGDPSRKPSTNAPEGFTRGANGLLRLTSFIYLRLVRTHELTTAERIQSRGTNPTEQTNIYGSLKEESHLP